jgi:putative ABC transport system substrate-binding protein
MNRRNAVLAILALGISPAAVLAQPAAKIAKIGFLSALGEASLVAREAAFRAGMKDLGYVEGKTYVIERRYSDGDAERLQRQADELVRLKVDVIVTTGPTTTPAAKKATSTIPIVMGFDGDPVGAGLVASLSRPGGNITGLTGLSAELTGKQLQLLKQIMPNLTRVAVLGNSKASGNAQSLGFIEATAKALKVQTHYLNAVDLEQVKAAFLAAGKARDEAIIVLANASTTSRPAEIVGLAQKARLPAIYYAPDFADAGGLVVYGANNIESFRRAAAFVDKILKGAKPGELPVEQPTVFTLVINMKAAKTLGITIPQSVLISADRVIE